MSKHENIHEEIREQQKKLKDRTFREKLSYFWDYYKVHTIVTILVVIVGSIFIRDALNAKEQAFSAIMLNSYGHEYQEMFQNDFAEYADIDLNVYDCVIDTSSTLSYESMSQMDMAVSQKITAMSQTEGIDVMVSDNAPFANFSSGMMFVDLREELSTAEYEKYESYFYYIDAALIGVEKELVYDEEGMPVIVDESIDHSDPSTMADPMPVGIYLTDSAKLKEWHCYEGFEESPIFGFVFSSGQKEKGHLFLEYLME